MYTLGLNKSPLVTKANNKQYWQKLTKINEYIRLKYNQTQLNRSAPQFVFNGFEGKSVVNTQKKRRTPHSTTLYHCDGITTQNYTHSIAPCTTTLVARAHRKLLRARVNINKQQYHVCVYVMPWQQRTHHVHLSMDVRRGLFSMPIIIIMLEKGDL